MTAQAKRFIIIANARTGSTFLKNMLRSHPSVLCFGEVFNQSKILWDMEDFNDRFDTQSLREARDANPLAFIEYIYSLGQENGAEHVGFKSLYHHYEYTPKHKQLIQYILQNEDIRIIHLKRSNSFKMYCSMEIARKRVAKGTTMNAYRADDVENNISITINPDNCLNYLKTAAVEEAKFDALFAHRNPLEVRYEELSANTSRVMAGVLHFLDLEPAPLSITTHKVRQQPISEVVTNYDEVASHLTAKGFGEILAL